MKIELTITPPTPEMAPQYGSCRCVCPDCKSGRHCYNRATNCGIVNG